MRPGRLTWPGRDAPGHDDGRGERSGPRSKAAARDHDTEQEVLAERNAHRNAVRERNVFYDEGEWPTTEKEAALRRKLYALEDKQSNNRIFWEVSRARRAASAVPPSVRRWSCRGWLPHTRLRRPIPI